MLSIEIKSHLEKKLLKNRAKREFENVKNKILEISASSETVLKHYKCLKNPVQHLQTARVKNHIILTFHYDKKNNTIIFLDYRYYKETHR